MESPFAQNSFESWQLYLEELFKIPDDGVIARRKYAYNQLRVHRKHSTSKSQEIFCTYENKGKRQKKHVHTESAGTLMSPKRVFQVRFKI